MFKHLGPAQTELCYEEAMEVELILRGFKNIRRQVPHPIWYKDFIVGVGYKDIVLDDDYVIELKAVSNLSLRDEAQVKKYLIEGQTGFLINFNPSREMAEVIVIEKPS